MTPEGEPFVIGPDSDPPTTADVLRMIERRDNPDAFETIQFERGWVLSDYSELVRLNPNWLITLALLLVIIVIIVSWKKNKQEK